MKIASVAVVLAAAGLAAADPHAHGHARLHRKRDAAVPTHFVYELAGKVIPASRACEGVADGSLEWADGNPPPDVCVTSTPTPTPSSTSSPTSSSTSTPTPSVTPAELLQQDASIVSLSSTSNPTPTPSTSSTTSSSTSTTESSTTESSTTEPTSSSSSDTSTSAIATASASSSGSSSGPGGVTLINNMNSAIYLWSVTDVPADMVTVPAGGTYSESWRINPSGGGISIKVSTTPSISDVLQYEYTLTGSTIFWDLSSINMSLNNLLSTVGFSVTSDNNPSCVADICQPGDLVCAATYLFPADNKATHGCDANTHMTFKVGLQDGGLL